MESFARQLLVELMPRIKLLQNYRFGVNEEYFKELFPNINKLYIELEFNFDKSNNYMNYPIAVSGKLHRALDKVFLIKNTIHISDIAKENIYPHLSHIYFDSLSNIRHELEHLMQHNIGKKKGNYISDNFNYNIKTFPLHLRNYYLQKVEVPAFVSGLYLKAKKERKSFLEILETDLISNIREALKLHYSRFLDEKTATNRSNEESSDIKDEMLNYAYRRYPLIRENI